MAVRLRNWIELARKAEDALVGLIDGTVQSYTVGNRTFTKNDLSELRDFYEHARALAERDQNGGPISVVDMNC